jgi:hypothetical protein
VEIRTANTETNTPPIPPMPPQPTSDSRLVDWSMRRATPDEIESARRSGIPALVSNMHAQGRAASYIKRDIDTPVHIMLS